MRDFQKRRVYAWENAHVHAQDKYLMSLSECQDWVDLVWSTMGLNHSPIVRPSRKNSRKATGCRLEIVIPEQMRTRSILLHELTHALTNDGHGPKFVWKYIGLLDRFLNLPTPLLLYTANKDGVKFRIGA